MSTAAAEMMLQCVLGETLSVHDMDIERRPYHKNCSCALHKSKREQSTACSHHGNIFFPKKQNWNDSSLSKAASKDDANSVQYRDGYFVLTGRLEDEEAKREESHIGNWKMKVYYVIVNPRPPEPGENEEESVAKTRERLRWDQDDEICRGHILNGMSNTLFDTYHTVKTAKELWNQFERRYITEDATSKRNSLKHRKEDINLDELGTHLRIEEDLRKEEKSKSEGLVQISPAVSSAQNRFFERKTEVECSCQQLEDSSESYSLPQGQHAKCDIVEKFIETSWGINTAELEGNMLQSKRVFQNIATTHHIRGPRLANILKTTRNGEAEEAAWRAKLATLKLPSNTDEQNLQSSDGARKFFFKPDK
ncbi:hypothetical protein RJ639_040714 [Escallonia herrerae]|uniref:Uncharacterized protein n=1 Tax=Escallonia herrerae TaxID=1293975 RepID=A0AA88WIG6_9ASTE|nr:hypothetical protein RJ639_040714 [Escallonia herrerae]